MDNIAHTLVGAALGRATADRHVARAALVGAIAANMPDWVEFFTGYWGWSPTDRLIHHRGITHSLVAAPFEIVALTVAMGLIARVWTRWRGSGAAPSWRWLALCVAVAYVSHLLMDWQGSYGWRPFLPWSSRWYYLDWVAIVDPFFWLVPLVALAWGADRHWIPLSATLLAGAAIWLFIVLYVSNDGVIAPWVIPLAAMICAVGLFGWIRYWFGPIERQRLAAFAVLVLATYAIAQGIVGQQRKREVRQQAESRFGRTATWAALTIVGQPFAWEAISASRDTVAGDGWRVPRHLRDTPVERVLSLTTEGRAMSQFARFLTAEIDTTDNTIFLRDARYARGRRNGWGVLAVRPGSAR